MAWRHVEDSEPVQKSFWGHEGTKSYGSRKQSTQTIALSTWRCGHCSALAVTRKGTQPTGKCGKCHNE